MKYLDQVYFNNTIGSYLLVSVTILAAFILKRMISKYATALLFKTIDPQKSKLDKSAFESLIVTPVEKILFVLISFFAIDRLYFPEILRFKIHTVTSEDLLDGIAAAIIIVYFITFLVRLMDFLVLLIKNKAAAGKSPGDHQLLFFFKDFIRVVLIIIGIILVLKFSFRLNISNLLTGLSIVGAALALAARESLENLIASFIIFFDKPFETGDLVKVNNYSGTVERIGLRSTRLRTNEKSMVTVPNKQMVDSILDNWSMRDVIRNEVKTFLPASSTSEEIEKVIAGIKTLLSERKEIVQTSSVYLQEINSDNAIIMVIYFTKYPMNIDDINQLKQEVSIAIRKLQEQHEIKPNTPASVKLVS